MEWGGDVEIRFYPIYFVKQFVSRLSNWTLRESDL